MTIQEQFEFIYFLIKPKSALIVNNFSPLLTPNSIKISKLFEPIMELNFLLSNLFFFKKEFWPNFCPLHPSKKWACQRKHRHILNEARALLLQSSLPNTFWGKSIKTAVYLINRTPSPLLKRKTPLNFFSISSNYSHLRVFGCLCYLKHCFPNKFLSRNRQCLFLGYPYGKKRWYVDD